MGKSGTELREELRRAANNFPTGEEYEPPDETLKQFYSDYLDRIHRLVSENRTFANLDCWNPG